MLIFNTREDLDAAKGTSQYNDFMVYLKGTLTRKEDKQVYPEGYHDFDYSGDHLDPIWEDVEDLSTIERFGFTKADFS